MWRVRNQTTTTTQLHMHYNVIHRVDGCGHASMWAGATSSYTQTTQNHPYHHGIESFEEEEIVTF